MRAQEIGQKKRLQKKNGYEGLMKILMEEKYHLQKLSLEHSLSNHKKKMESIKQTMERKNRKEEDLTAVGVKINEGKDNWSEKYDSEGIIECKLETDEFLDGVRYGEIYMSNEMSEDEKVNEDVPMFSEKEGPKELLLWVLKMEVYF